MPDDRDHRTDDLDRRIVAALGRDGRADALSIAGEIDAVATTVQKRLRALEADDVIRGYTVRLDYEALGYRTVLLWLDADHAADESVSTRLRETTNVVTVYETTGRYNVFAVGKFEDESAIGRLLERLHADPDVRAVDARRVRASAGDGVIGNGR